MPRFTSESDMRNWPMIISGILLVVFGLTCAFFPGITLISVAIMVGIGFIFAGVMTLLSYSKNKGLPGFDGWMVPYGVLDIVIGAMFLIHPVATASVLSWLIGAFLLVFGVFQVVQSFRFRKLATGLWVWELAMGILTAVLGVLFFVYPVLLALYIGLFAVMRGVTLIVFGAKYGSSLGSF